MLKKFLNLLGIGTGSVSSSDKSKGSSINDLTDFVEYVVKQLVDDPNAIIVDSKETKDGVKIQVKCNKEDIGKIVGKHGKTIMAIRSLVSGAAGRQRKRVSVDILDE